MRMLIKPASMLLVGVLFICVLCSSASVDQLSDSLNAFNKFESQSLYSLHREASSGWGELKVGEDSVYFPWHRSSSHVSPPLSSSVSSASSSVSSEEVMMDCSNSAISVGDLSAMNSQQERTLSFKDSQSGDPSYIGLANSLDISVRGRRADESPIQSVDIDDLNRLGNHLSVDVHGIYVSAVNTVPGGNAVATSNIVIEPVQIIICPSEVEEKLR